MAGGSGHGADVAGVGRAGVSVLRPQEEGRRPQRLMETSGAGPGAGAGPPWGPGAYCLEWAIPPQTPMPVLSTGWARRKWGWGSPAESPNVETALVLRGLQVRDDGPGATAAP